MRRALMGVGVVALLGGWGSACSTKQPAEDGAGPDRSCLGVLRKAGVAFTERDGVRGVRTPVVVRGPLDGIRLLPRSRREALMDCALARGLLEAAPVLRGLDIDGLEFSGAYDYRARRDSAVLSAHARGLAIDVHVVHSGPRRYVVATDFEAGVGEWRRLRPGSGMLAACIGAARTPAGQKLRALACRLKLDTAFRIVVTPDDNADHRDHLHLEVYPDVADPAPKAGSG